jgi:hypothetical protein
MIQFETIEQYINRRIVLHDNAENIEGKIRHLRSYPVMIVMSGQLGEMRGALGFNHLRRRAGYPSRRIWRELSFLSHEMVGNQYMQSIGVSFRSHSDLILFRISI